MPRLKGYFWGSEHGDGLMFIYKDGVSYSAVKVLDTHCCEIQCLIDGAKGGWKVLCTEKKATRNGHFIVREFCDSNSLEQCLTQAAMHYLKENN